MIPDEAVKAAEVAYYETLTELRLAEGGGFKVGSQVKRSIHAALEAAAPHMQRTITTAEELDALPDGSAYLMSEGLIGRPRNWSAISHSLSYPDGSMGAIHPDRVTLPVTVLWEPQP